mgnify:CR=1 FL=1
MLRGLQTGFLDLLRELRGRGITLSLDTGFDPANQWKDGIRDVIRLVRRAHGLVWAHKKLVLSHARVVSCACMQMDLFFPNETEAMAISGKGSVDEALEELTRDTDALVVITTGPQGAIAKRGRQVWTHAAFDVPSTPPRLHIAHPTNPTP